MKLEQVELLSLNMTSLRRLLIICEVIFPFLKALGLFLHYFLLFCYNFFTYASQLETRHFGLKHNLDNFNCLQNNKRRRLDRLAQMIECSLRKNLTSMLGGDLGSIQRPPGFFQMRSFRKYV